MQGVVQVIHTSIGSRFEAMVAVTMKLLMVLFDQSHSRAQERDHKGAAVGYLGRSTGVAVQVRMDAMQCRHTGKSERR